MTPEEKPASGWDYSADFDESNHSFHDLLLNRSKEALPSRKRKGQAKPQVQKAGPGLGAALFRLSGEVAVFAGGGAIGAGTVMLARGDSVRGPAGLALALGTGTVLVSVVVRLVLKVRAKSMA